MLGASYFGTNDYWPVNDSASIQTSRSFFDNVLTFLQASSSFATASHAARTYYVISASHAIVAATVRYTEATASHALNADSASYTHWGFSGSYAITASNAKSASYAKGGNFTFGEGTPNAFVSWAPTGNVLSTANVGNSSSLIDVKIPLSFSQSVDVDGSRITLYTGSVGLTRQICDIGVQGGIVYMRNMSGFWVYESGSYVSTPYEPGPDGVSRFCVYRDTVGIGNFSEGVDFPGADLHISSSRDGNVNHLKINGPKYDILEISSSGATGVFKRSSARHRLDVSGPVNASSYWVDDRTQQNKYIPGRTFQVTLVSSSIAQEIVHLQFTNGILTNYWTDGVLLPPEEGGGQGEDYPPPPPPSTTSPPEEPEEPIVEIYPQWVVDMVANQTAINAGYVELYVQNYRDGVYYQFYAAVDPATPLGTVVPAYARAPSNSNFGSRHPVYQLTWTWGYATNTLFFNSLCRWNYGLGEIYDPDGPRLL